MPGWYWQFDTLLGPDVQEVLAPKIFLRGVGHKNILEHTNFDILNLAAVQAI